VHIREILNEIEKNKNLKVKLHNKLFTLKEKNIEFVKSIIQIKPKNYYELNYIKVIIYKDYEKFENIAHNIKLNNKEIICYFSNNLNDKNLIGYEIFKATYLEIKNIISEYGFIKIYL
jgi:hypothetical protein